MPASRNASVVRGRTTPSLSRPVGRRGVLTAGLATAGAVLVGCSPGAGVGVTRPPAPADFAARMTELERRFGGRVGVAAVEGGTGRRLGHRDGERFLMCSTVKVAIVAAVLHRTRSDPGLLRRRLRWTRADLLSYAPATTRSIDTGLIVAELCAATLTRSDNTAANLLSDQVGGAPGITAFLRAGGDTTTRVDRSEPTLNDRVGDLDTTTPSAFAATLEALTLGRALPPPLRDQLVRWMVANTTGDAQIRAGTPRGWSVADKTGSGSSGESHDVGVVWPPGRPPIVLAVYTVPTDPENETGRATIAAATREVLDQLGA